MDWTYVARALFTLLCFISFIIFVIVTYRVSSKKHYDELAKTIMTDEDSPLNSLDNERASAGVKNNE